ncbi:MAG: hypothetical protein JNM68_03130 [Dinghuibacter sp.]|nr:hypothetical protein [Dinghuibacter sp.]
MKKTVKKLDLKKATVQLLTKHNTKTLAGGASHTCSNNSCVRICHEN